MTGVQNTDQRLFFSLSRYNDYIVLICSTVVLQLLIPTMR